MSTSETRTDVIRRLKRLLARLEANLESFVNDSNCYIKLAADKKFSIAISYLVQLGFVADARKLNADWLEFFTALTNEHMSGLDPYYREKLQVPSREELDAYRTPESRAMILKFQAHDLLEHVKELQNHLSELAVDADLKTSGNTAISRGIRKWTNLDQLHDELRPQGKTDGEIVAVFKVRYSKQWSSILTDLRKGLKDENEARSVAEANAIKHLRNRRQTMKRK
ncbi:MAG TPA: hypothetical protein VMJ32_17010 [Pirellulales bacterium]|nr:hypothetical protein [Pirellulales bacterium]